jgi:hypothetical protein
VKQTRLFRLFTMIGLIFLPAIQGCGDADIDLSKEIPSCSFTLPAHYVVLPGESTQIANPCDPSGNGTWNYGDELTIGGVEPRVSAVSGLQVDRHTDANGSITRSLTASSDPMHPVTPLWLALLGSTTTRHPPPPWRQGPPRGRCLTRGWS